MHFEVSTINIGKIVVDMKNEEIHMYIVFKASNESNIYSTNRKTIYDAVIIIWPGVMKLKF